MSDYYGLCSVNRTLSDAIAPHFVHEMAYRCLALSRLGLRNEQLHMFRLMHSRPSQLRVEIWKRKRPLVGKDSLGGENCSLEDMAVTAICFLSCKLKACGNDLLVSSGFQGCYR